MLKTVSSVINAIGALNYKGTWDASTNNPTLTSSVGTKGDYYVVSVAGSTSLDGETLWGVGDWAVFNGSIWQKVDGGDSGNFVNISVSSLTGYMYGNGTANVSASTTIPVANITGAVPNTVNVIAGGLITGGGALTGNVTLTLNNVPNANVTGLGTMATQNANSVVITGGTIDNVVIGNSTPSTALFTTANVSSQLNLTNASNYNVNATGAGGNFFAGIVGIGQAPSTGYSLLIAYPVTGASTAFGISNQGVIQSSVSSAIIYRSSASTAAASFTLGSVTHYQTSQSTIGSGSSVTSQYGFFANSNMTGATNNYGYFGNIASATGAYNLYMSGTANNYMAGSLGIGTTSPNTSALLDVQSTTKGVRFPNMTTTQKNAISSPAAGLVVFDTTLAKLCVYSGSAWQTITSV